VFLTEEELKRKEEFLELQKSKQERSDVELAALRQVVIKRLRKRLRRSRVKLESFANSYKGL